MVISATFAIVGLSVVVLTGYTGQLSLAQFALAGIGAFTAGKLAAAHGWRFEPALLAGVLVAMAVGFLFGLPALRTRGVNLAVVTFGLGLRGRPAGLQQQLLHRERPGAARRPVAARAGDGPGRSPAQLRAGLRRVPGAGGARGGQPAPRRIGRRLLAVRTNERAAAAIGVNVFEAKLYAFTLSAGIAGLGGVLLGFSNAAILYQSLFQPGASISVLVLTVIGSAGYLAGPMVGLAAGLWRAGHPHLVRSAGERRGRGRVELAAVPADRAPGCCCSSC